jgi:predicted transcriptional regulator
MKKEYQRFLEAAIERRAEARKLREQGLNFTQIGKKLGITRQRAFQLVGPKHGMLRRKTDLQQGQSEGGMQRTTVG